MNHCPSNTLRSMGIMNRLITPRLCKLSNASWLGTSSVARYLVKRHKTKRNERTV
jgi:hypothetical protein